MSKFLSPCRKRNLKRNGLSALFDPAVRAREAAAKRARRRADPETARAKDAAAITSPSANLSNGDVKLFVDTACNDFDAKYRNRPFVLVGDFNVDISDPSNQWIVQHMAVRYSLRSLSKTAALDGEM
ncbi:hypothetical protein HPB50_024841 [Hyalomma asiaticum]|uniref:Uncharacterized protein n=1 Tax=Hyalomma asiaticum TaxID=266040 RepID=A0ACB7RL43_HYAAI|nr:hypothetical protein HPB50_024841 [Hyalomma asiaticum]